MDPEPRFTANYVAEPPKVGMPKMSLSFDLKKILIIVGILIVVVVGWTYLSSPLVVTVTGSGEVAVPATNATVSFTLSATDNSSVAAAVASVQTKANTMRAFLMKSGVAEGDIAESQVTAVPAALVATGATGYQATVSMAAKTVHVANVSNLVSDLYTNGALVVAQPVLSVENQDKLNQQAFDSAMKDANTQAQTIGFSNWKFIRKVISISQATSSSTSTSTTKADTLTSANNVTAATNGVFKIVKAVSVSYKMW
jgi:uncharacterized protein YggE